MQFTWPVVSTLETEIEGRTWPPVSGLLSNGAVPYPTSRPVSTQIASGIVWMSQPR